MYTLRCPYCPGTHGRCTTTAGGRSVTECCSCGRIVEERHSSSHALFHLRAVDTPLPLSTPDLPFTAGDDVINGNYDDDDPFHPTTGFLTAFSTWSLEHAQVFARTSSSFSGMLAELERALVDPANAGNSTSSSDAAGGPNISVDHLRAYLQIVDVSSILGLDRDISDHAFQLFRDCSSAICLRNRSVEALATAALVHAIREAQEPRTLQEISTASNLPQKEIGKYIKILGEALKLSQPINSNSISVHMPRFCNLLQLNKSAQELAAHIGEVVVNKCFCTRRNPISISAAAIYLACQLEDKRKTQAEICKVTGLTEVTLRKVYKELLENWDDLLPPNYTPAVPPEKAFPMTSITSGRPSASKIDVVDLSHSMTNPDKQQSELRSSSNHSAGMDIDHKVREKEELEKTYPSHEPSTSSFNLRDLNQAAFWQPKAPSSVPSLNLDADRNQKGDQGKKSMNRNVPLSVYEHKVDRDSKDSKTAQWMINAPPISSSKRDSNLLQANVPKVVLGPTFGAGANHIHDNADGNHKKNEG